MFNELITGILHPAGWTNLSGKERNLSGLNPKSALTTELCVVQDFVNAWEKVMNLDRFDR